METDPQMAALLARARQFLAMIPLGQALAFRLDQIGGGRAVISMPWDERLIGDPRTGVIHGGAISALMDTCCGAAAISHPEGPEMTATLDLRIDYMRPAAPRQRITATAEVFRMTRSVAFLRATACDEQEGQPVATATAAFTVDFPKEDRT
ncbi:PaaI family thioesterase [Paenirhodobacter populi]|nr:PaaI family thioesterase [Sinirhodobacter populi]